MQRIRRNRGFTVIEIITVIGLLSGLILLGINTFKGSISFASDVQAGLDLKTINEAVDVYISRHDAIPSGNHDKKHHATVIEKLVDDGLILGENIEVDSLISQGEKNQFQFTGYKGKKIKYRPWVEYNPPKEQRVVKWSRPELPEVWAVRKHIRKDKNSSTNEIDQESIRKSVLDEMEARLLEKERKNATLTQWATFKVAGRYTWTVPEHVKKVTVEGIGAGGGGGTCEESDVWTDEQTMMFLSSGSNDFLPSIHVNRVGFLKLETFVLNVETPAKIRIFQEYNFQDNNKLSFCPKWVGYFIKDGKKQDISTLSNQTKLDFNDNGEIFIHLAVYGATRQYNDNVFNYKNQAFSLSPKALIQKKKHVIQKGFGGGGGAFFRKKIPVTEGDNFVIEVGAGGAPEKTGGQTRFSGNGWNLVAGGGEGGTREKAGAGGKSSSGDFHINGASGKNSNGGYPSFDKPQHSSSGWGGKGSLSEARNPQSGADGLILISYLEEF